MLSAEVGDHGRAAAFIRTGLTDGTTAALIAATAKKPQATICLLSALSIHDLTDENPTRSDIALPRGSQPPRITISPVRWHRFDPATFEVGRTQQSLPGGGRIGLRVGVSRHGAEG